MVQTTLRRLSIGALLVALVQLAPVVAPSSALAAADAKPTPTPTKPAPTTAPAKPTPTPAPPKPTPVPTPTGYDVSYPQCGRSLPAQPAFGVVGVNGGLAYSGNPCLSAEYSWAADASSPSQAHISFYLNTGNPGPTLSTHWPAAGTTTPRSCDGTWSADCAYDYGWYAAQDSFGRAAAVAGTPAATAAPWWLDVESANSWSSDAVTNSADLQGAIAYLRSAGVATVGIYATVGDWAQIVGASSAASASNEPFRSLLNWVPGARAAKDAPAACSRTFTGGRVKLVQYPSGGFDADYACF